MSVPEVNSNKVRETASNFYVYALMLLATLLVATSFPVVAAIAHGLDSVVLTFVRFALATLLFAPLLIWQRRLSIPTFRDLMRYSVLSILLVTFFWCMFGSLQLTSPLNTAAIFALSPVITAVFAAMLLGDKTNGSVRIALVLGAAGAIWVVFRGDLQALVTLQLGAGDLLFLAGTIALSGYSALVKFLHRGEPMVQMTFWTLATGAIWLFLLATPKLGDVQWGEVPHFVYLGVAYLSVFTTIVTFFLFQWSTTRIGPTSVVSYTFLNPALVLLIGLLLGDALPPLVTWPGVALAIGATILLQSKSTNGGVAVQRLSHPRVAKIKRIFPARLDSLELTRFTKRPRWNAPGATEPTRVR